MLARASGERIGFTMQTGCPRASMTPGCGTGAPAGASTIPRNGEATLIRRPGGYHDFAAITDRPRDRLALDIDERESQPLFGLGRQFDTRQLGLLDGADDLGRLAAAECFELRLGGLAAGPSPMPASPGRQPESSGSPEPVRSAAATLSGRTASHPNEFFQFLTSP